MWSASASQAESAGWQLPDFLDYGGAQVLGPSDDRAVQVAVVLKDLAGGRVDDDLFSIPEAIDGCHQANAGAASADSGAADELDTWLLRHDLERRQAQRWCRPDRVFAEDQRGGKECP